MRSDYPRLLEARPTDGWSVWLQWEDGLAAEVDLGRVVGDGPVFRPLRDPDYFRRISIYPSGMTLHWPNEADIAPETLYEWNPGSRGCRGLDALVPRFLYTASPPT